MTTGIGSPCRASAAVTVAVAVVLVALPGARPAVAAAPSWVRWVHQLGSGTLDLAARVAVDGSGNTYAVGTTRGTLPGSPESNAGAEDVFIASWDRAGNRRWLHQFGSPDHDRGTGVALDGAGNVYFSGTTFGTLPGSGKPTTGRSYGFVVSYDGAGQRRWGPHQIGDGVKDTAGSSVAVDGSGRVYVTGWTLGTLPRSPDPHAGKADVFVASWDGTGERRWVRQLGSVSDIDCGTGDDLGRGIAVDRLGNVYVTGATFGSLPGSPNAYRGNCDTADAFVASWDGAGARRWVYQFGAGDSAGGWGVAADRAGNVYLAGHTYWRLPSSPDPFAGGWSDAFVASFDGAGTPRWTHLLGANSDTDEAGEGAEDITVSPAGHVYVTGATEGTLPGSPEPFAGGIHDVFVASYDAAGNRRWVHQLGSPRDDEGLGVAADRLGNVFVAGLTNGRLPKSPEARAGDLDAFVARFKLDG